MSVQAVVGHFAALTPGETAPGGPVAVHGQVESSAMLSWSPPAITASDPRAADHACGWVVPGRCATFGSFRSGCSSSTCASSTPARTSMARRDGRCAAVAIRHVGVRARCSRPLTHPPPTRPQPQPLPKLGVVVKEAELGTTEAVAALRRCASSPRYPNPNNASLVVLYPDRS